MKNWIDTNYCKNRVAGNYLACHFCRMSKAFQDFQAMTGQVQNPRDAVCPDGVPVGTEHPEFLKRLPKPKMDGAPSTPAPTVDGKPPVTAAKAASFLQAMLLAPRVTKEMEAARLTICSTCEHLRHPADGAPDYCGLCGCKVSSEGWRVMNLAAYEENLPKWGCKHPQRGWKRPDGSVAGWPVPVAETAKK